ncbi:MAG: isochorismatase family protein [Pseudomonadota bacterium]
MNDMKREDLLAPAANEQIWTRREFVADPLAACAVMKWIHKRLPGLVAVAGFGFVASTAFAQTIVDEWTNVKAPPAPQLKPVTVDPKTTALLMLDFMNQNCGARPRCIASLPAVRQFLAEARAKQVMIVYATGPGGKVADTRSEVAPTGSEPVVTAGPDKFLNTDLDKILKDKGIQTVITIGTAAEGAVLYTASAAGLRGLKVIVPVDGVSAESVYPEQYTAWHLANAPVFSRNVTLTKMDMVKF